MKSLVSTGVVTLALFLSACGAGDSNVTPIDAHTVLSGGLSSSDTELSGSGTVVFNSPLAGVTSGNSYALTFTLSDGGSLVLGANSSATVTGGLGVSFARSGTTLTVTLISGATNKDVSAEFTGVNASGTLTLQIDVHNDETPAHVLVWTGSNYSEGAAVLNSEDAGLDAPGNGTGQFWGLTLGNAIVTRASVSAPKFDE